MTTQTFRYINNAFKLWLGLLCAVCTALMIWVLYIGPEAKVNQDSLFIQIFYVVMLTFTGWMAIDSLRTYVKLWGHERLVVIDERSITLPEFGDSLNVIKLDFARIHKVYFLTTQHGNATDLAILYDQEGYADINRSSLKRSDFDEICAIFKSRLNLDEIKTF